MKQLNDLMKCWLESNPWTNVYGFSRSILALSSLLTLIFNKTEYLFREGAGMSAFPDNGAPFGIFMIGQNNYYLLGILKFIAIIVLLLVVIGWRPRITGILHWYIAFSMQNGLTIADGGEQVASVITFLLIPITLTDTRKWHWNNQFQEGTYSKIIAFSTYYIIRIQIAIIYFHSVIAKIKDREWINGTAVYYYIKDSNLGFNSFFQYLTDWIFNSNLVPLTAWIPLLVQIILFCALFMSKKYWKIVLVIGICMHEVFALFLGLISFSLIMLGVLILYLTPIEKHIKFIKRSFKNEI
ncbi:sporulation-delaying protein SdpB family protein [Staphylococcus shinii]